MCDILLQFSPALNDIYVIRKAHLRSTRSLRSLSCVAFGIVSLLVLLTMVISRPFKAERRAFSLSTPPFPGDRWYGMSLALCSQGIDGVACPWLCVPRRSMVWHVLGSVVAGSV